LAKPKQIPDVRKWKWSKFYFTDIFDTF
jgi:hypothetical protein